MSVGATRKGFTQAKFNEDAVNIIFGEILILSCSAGFYYSSWYVFGGMVIGLIVCMYIPVINIIMGLGLSCLWAIMGATVVCFFQDVQISDITDFIGFLTTVFSTPASQVIGGILFLSGLGAHLGAIEWARDVGDSNERNIS